jgi:hypothetical protein
VRISGTASRTRRANISGEGRRRGNASAYWALTVEAISVADAAVAANSDFQEFLTSWLEKVIVKQD